MPDQAFIEEQLKRIESDAVRAQSYSPGYHPLDVAFWVHRDALDLAPDLSPADRARLLDTMASILETAQEETIESAQRQRFRVRQQELQLRMGETAVGEDLAQQMRKQGDFSGEIALARFRLLEAQRHNLNVQDKSKEELGRLLAFRPAILKHLHAVRYMQTLWAKTFLERNLGEGAPQQVQASSEDWRVLADITRSRLQSADDSEHPYALFCLGWALLQIGEGHEAREIFTRLERQSLGNPRRVGELAALTNEDGSLRVFHARVIHSHVGQVRLSIPEIGTEVFDLRPEVETQVAPGGLRLGEYVDVSVALNYRGLLLRPPTNERPARTNHRR
jgi:hypothetical protein